MQGFHAFTVNGLHINQLQEYLEDYALSHNTGQGDLVLHMRISSRRDGSVVVDSSGVPLRLPRQNVMGLNAAAQLGFRTMCARAVPSLEVGHDASLLPVRS